MYGHLKKQGFAFPNRSTMTRWLQRLNLQPGICKPLFDFMAAKVASMTKWEKKAILMFDEMCIKNSLEYDCQRDLVEGKSFIQYSKC